MKLRNTIPIGGRKVYDVTPWPDDEHTNALLAQGVLQYVDDSFEDDENWTLGLDADLDATDEP